MHLRPFRQPDLSAMATITAENNRTDTLSRFMTRDIDKYPFTYRQGCLRFLKGLMSQVGAVGFVVVSDSSDEREKGEDERGIGQEGEVIGYAIFQRNGTSPTAQTWQQDSYAAKLNRFLLGLEARYQRTPPFTHSEHTFNHTNFALILPLLSTPWESPRFDESWEILSFYTAQRWQGRGVGGLMMKWGKERATEEGVALIVAGSPIGGVVYRRMGFRKLGTSGLGVRGGFDELEFGGEEMGRWVWEPQEKGTGGD